MICAITNLQKPLTPEVVVRDRVVYECLPPLCPLCSRFGHSAHCCPYPCGPVIPSPSNPASPLSKLISSAIPSASDPSVPEPPLSTSVESSPFRPTDFPPMSISLPLLLVPRSYPTPRVSSFPKKQPLHLRPNNQPIKKSRNLVSSKPVPQSSHTFVSSSGSPRATSVVDVSPPSPSNFPSQPLLVLSSPASPFPDSLSTSTVLSSLSSPTTIASPSSPVVPTSPVIKAPHNLSLTLSLNLKLDLATH